MYYVLSFILPLAYFLLFTASLVHIFRKSFGKCLPLSMLLSALLLFLSQVVFNTFNVGFILGILFALSSIVLTILKKKNLKAFREDYFTGGFVAFLVCYIAVFIYDLNQNLSCWDELSHWGIMVKEMLRLDRFYNDAGSTLTVHKDYPPIVSLFELFWTKISASGYSEPLLSKAVHTLDFSLIIPLLVEKTCANISLIKTVFRSFVSFFCFALIIILFDTASNFNSIYIDYTMALITIYLLISVLWSKKIQTFDIFSFAIGGTFLILTKQMGLPLFAMCFVELVGISILRKKERLPRSIKPFIKRLAPFAVAFLIPLVFWRVWSLLSSSEDKQFDLGSFTPGNIVNVLLLRGEDWQRSAIINFVKRLVFFNTVNSILQLSLVHCFILFSCLAAITCRLFGKEEKKESIFTFSLVLLGGIGYAFAMMILYATSFGPVEGPNLASFDRYMGTYLIIMFGFLAMQLFKYSFSSPKSNLSIALVIIIMLISPLRNISALTPSIRHTGAFQNYSLIADDLKAAIGDEANVYIIDTRIKGAPYQGYQYFLQYYATPINLNWHPDTTKWHVKTWNTDSTDEFEEYSHELEQNDYVFFVTVDDDFTNTYEDLLGVKKIKNGQIYKITTDQEDNFSKLEFVTNLEHYK